MIKFDGQNNKMIISQKKIHTKTGSYLYMICYIKELLLFQAYENVVAAAGYSVGELAALVASGAMTFEDGI